MSHKLAFCAGFLVTVALATPYLGAMVDRPAATAPVVTTAAPAPMFAPAPARPVPGPAPAALVVGPSAPDPVYGDAKIPDFDPEHPPARMGEPG
ncbi:hypothetical protein PX554_05855 [Sphingomonas sp. H39-1-10]|uniref:hypothetical protein n=1 Tax=Sphingomonas pollutisoli TaxID=3030829 RepID=UPI0023B9E5F9|nr:hypothetical protein [Sphingomonas pollutisoli]MDF0487647.1 hypothetical protein [Sphingomonas pollutisoli]